MGFATTYHVVASRLVIEQCAEEIAQLSSPSLLTGITGTCFPQRSDILSFRNRRVEPLVGFSLRADLAVWVGFTVTYVAMQITYFMGFKEVIFIGMDHSFITKGESGKVVTLKHGDPNHYVSGFRWELPNLEGSEQAYKLAKDYFEKDNRRIVDATIGGKLQVFPKVDFTSLFS